MRRTLLTIVVLSLALATPAHAGEWIAGDLHVHTTYSHDSWGGPGDDNTTDPQDYYTLGQTVTEDFAIAAARGLDYLAISDHNDIRSQSDPGFGFGGVMPVPAYENSLRGHGQMIGATKIYDNGDSGPAAVRALEDQLHAEGGALQANHPTSPKWDYTYDEVPVDTVEVWNLPWVYQPPFPASTDHDAALRFGEKILDDGHRVGFTGGSDSHWKSTVAAQGPGQPTTWVYVRERSVAGLVEGLRAGHTFVSFQPPNLGGPQVFLEGHRHGGWTAMPGDTIRPGSRMRVHVVGAPGGTLRILGDHDQVQLEVPVTSASFTKTFTLGDDVTYAFAEVFGQDHPEARQPVCSTVPIEDLLGTMTYCRNRIAMLALSSAIYLRDA
jgi:hypothetical protein